MRGFDFFFSYKDFLGSVQLQHDWKLSIALRILIFLTRVQAKLLINFPQTKENEPRFQKKTQILFFLELVRKYVSIIYSSL